MKGKGHESLNFNIGILWRSFIEKIILGLLISVRTKMVNGNHISSEEPQVWLQHYFNE